MSLRKHHGARNGLRILQIMLLFLLDACGGGGGLASLGGVGSGGTGSAMGTVTGLASVILDGNEFNDTQASWAASDAQGVNIGVPATQINLGDQVIMSLTGQGQTGHVQVQAQLAGTVSSLGVNSMMVNGLQVRISTDASLAPLTYFTGLGNFNDLAVGEQVEVFGAYGEDAQGPYLLATRVVLQPLGGLSLMTGRVQSYSPGSSTLVLGGISYALSSVALNQAATANLQPGQLVTLWMSSASTVVSALYVYSVQGLQGNLQISGIAYNLQSGQFQVDGITVLASAAQMTVVHEGSYVTVEGQVTGATVEASQVNAMTSSGAPVLLHGSVTQYVSSASLVVRGIPVDASHATINGNLANGIFVEIQGQIAGNTVLATQVDVQAPPVQATLDQQGIVTALDMTQSTLTLNAEDGASYQVHWTNNVFVVPVKEGAKASLSQLMMGQQIEVHGQVQADGSLLADTLTFSGNPPSAPGKGGLEVHGVVYSYNAALGIFYVNNLSFSLGQVNVQGGTLANGSAVDISFMPGAPNQVLTLTMDN